MLGDLEEAGLAGGFLAEVFHEGAEPGDAGGDDDDVCFDSAVGGNGLAPRWDH